jgi:biotin carboxylase
MTEVTDCVLVFIESNITGTGAQAIRTAAGMGLRPVFVTGMPERYAGDADMSSTLRTCADRVLICDTKDPDVVGAALLDLSSQPAGVTTVHEYFVPTAARVARKLGLPGLSPEAAVIARDKLRSRIACAERGVAVPAFEFVRSVDDVDRALLRLGLPCVVKPIDESGSIGVTLCRTRDEVATRIAELISSPANSKGQPRTPGGLVEACLFGHEVSVETFTFNGETTVLGVTDKLLGSTPYFVEYGHTFPSVLPDSVTGPAAANAVAALNAVGFDFGPAHVEVKICADGPKLIEINARTGGDLVPELVQHATGVALLEQTIRAAMGGVPDLTPRRRQGAAIRFAVGRDGRVASVTGDDLRKHFPAVVDSRLKVAPGDTTRWPVDSFDRLGHVLAVGPTSHEAAIQAEAALPHLTVTYTAD